MAMIRADRHKSTHNEQQEFCISIIQKYGAQGQNWKLCRIKLLVMYLCSTIQMIYLADKHQLSATFSRKII